MRIIIDDLTSPEIADLIEAHTSELRELSPPESKHALAIDGLRKPDTTVWSVWDESVLIGCGALKDLGEGHAELKSMRVIAGYAGQGIGSHLLQHLLAEARARGYQRVSLETGSIPFFEPARSLYRKHGFVECGPFGQYVDDPNSTFMTLTFD